MFSFLRVHCKFRARGSPCIMAVSFAFSFHTQYLSTISHYDFVSFFALKIFCCFFFLSISYGLWGNRVTESTHRRKKSSKWVSRVNSNTGQSPLRHRYLVSWRDFILVWGGWGAGSLVPFCHCLSREFFCSSKNKSSRVVKVEESKTLQNWGRVDSDFQQHFDDLHQIIWTLFHRSLQQ